jgi:DNA-binding phage protein
MAVTRTFRETVIKRAAADEEYRRSLLAHAVSEILEGNLSAGKAMLRDYINATITFPELARRLNKSSKSIHRMFGPAGNPRMDSVVGVLRVLQEEEKVRLKVKTA